MSSKNYRLEILVKAGGIEIVKLCSIKQEKNKIKGILFRKPNCSNERVDKTK